MLIREWSFKARWPPQLTMKYDTEEVIYSMTNTRQKCKHTLDTFTSLTWRAPAGHAAWDSILFKNNTKHARDRLVVCTYYRAPVLYVTLQTEQCSSSSVSARAKSWLVFLFFFLVWTVLLLNIKRTLRHSNGQPMPSVWFKHERIKTFVSRMAWLHVVKTMFSQHNLKIWQSYIHFEDVNSSDGNVTQYFTLPAN